MSEVKYKPMDVKVTPYPHVEKAEYGRTVDPVGYLNAVEQRARERQVAIETVKILRERLRTCARREGVNGHENCRKEALDYLEVINRRDIGQLQPNWRDPEKKDGWSGYTEKHHHS
ncbi:hypothetical protein ACA910_003425 [Epithemia clementina (nom. ined.)]